MLWVQSTRYPIDTKAVCANVAWCVVFLEVQYLERCACSVSAAVAERKTSSKFSDRQITKQSFM